LTFWGWIFLVTTILIWALKTEKPEVDENNAGPWERVKSSYAMLFRILKLPAVQTLVIFNLTAKVSYKTLFFDQNIGRSKVTF